MQGLALSSLLFSVCEILKASSGESSSNSGDDLADALMEDMERGAPGLGLLTETHGFHFCTSPALY